MKVVLSSVADDVVFYYNDLDDDGTPVSYEGAMNVHDAIKLCYDLGEHIGRCLAYMAQHGEHLDLKRMME